MQTEQEAYHQLSYYTLSHPDPSFIHQHIVDAYTAQVADEQTKPITLMFALAGLYLSIEKEMTGKQVQLMHMKMAQKKRTWPTIELPNERGSIRVAAVLAVPSGEKRDLMIQQWCEAVWNAYATSHATVAAVVAPFLV